MSRDLIRAAFEGDPSPARLWRWTLALIAALLCFTAALFPIVSATYDARLARDAARAPHTTPADLEAVYSGELVWTPDSPQAWINLSHTFGQDLESIQVLSFTPPSAPQPPPVGLPRWPAPGEVFATPAVLDLEGGRAFIDAFGEYAGTVEVDTLADPSELMLYVGLDPTLVSPPGYWLPVTDFGVAAGKSGDQGYYGSALYQADRTTFWIGLGTFVLAPGLLMTGAVLRLGADRRERELLRVRALGATAWQLARSIAAALAGPVLAGAAAAALAVTLLSLRGITVPFTGYVLAGGDVRAGFGGAAAAIAIAAAGVLLLGVLSYRPWVLRGVGARLLPRHERTVRPIALWITGGAVAIANWGYVAFDKTNPQLALYLRLICVAVAVAMLAPTLRPLVGMIARAYAAAARRLGSASLLTASRDLQRFGAATLRYAAIAGSVVILGLQIQVLVGQGDAIAREAAAAFGRNGDRVLMTAGYDGDPAWVSAMLTRPEETYATLQIETNPLGEDSGSGDRPGLSGTCENLQAAFERCPDGTELAGDLGITRPELRLYGVDENTPVQILGAQSGAIDPERTRTLLYVTRSGEPLTHAEVIDDLRQVIAPIPVVEAIGQSQGTGARLGAEQTVWLQPAMLLTSAFALVAVAGALLMELARSASRNRSMLRQAGAADTVTFAAATVGVPIALVAVVGTILGAAFVVAPTSDATSFATISPTGIAALAALGLAAAALATAIGYRLLERSATT